MRLRGRAEISGGQSVGRFVDRVPDLATWDTICHRASVGLPGAETVKVVVDRRSGDGAEAMTPYFLQTR